MLKDAKPTGWDDTAFTSGRYGSEDPIGATLPSMLLRIQEDDSLVHHS